MNPLEPTTQHNTTSVEARKFDNEKNRWDLLPFRAIDLVARIMTYGAKKYGDRNWENGANEAFAQRQIAAAYRHLKKHMTGNVYDSESGLRHLAHAATDILMALELNILMENNKLRKTDE